MDEILLKIKNNFSGSSLNQKIPFSGEKIDFVAFSRDKELRLGPELNGSDVFAPVVLKVSSEVGDKSLNIEVPDRIHLRVTTKVTQGTRHLILDIIHVEQFWLDKDRTNDRLFTTR